MPSALDGAVPAPVAAIARDEATSRSTQPSRVEAFNSSFSPSPFDVLRKAEKSRTWCRSGRRTDEIHGDLAGVTLAYIGDGNVTAIAALDQALAALAGVPGTLSA